jgi:hypothetical protein
MQFVRAVTAASGVAVIGMAVVLGATSPPGDDPHAMAMAHGPEAMPPANVEVRSKDGRVTIPFHMSANHVVIPVILQGAQLEVILDTGMPMEGMTLYRNDKVGRLKLPVESGIQARVGGAGGGAATAADLVQGLTLDIADLRLTDVRALVMPPVKTFAPDHDGVIGFSIFRNFVVAIDYDQGRITLYDPKTFTPPAEAKSLPITLEKNMAFTDIGVLTSEGKRIPARVVVDLGAGHPISLNLGMIAGLEPPAGALPAIVGRGISGVLRGQVGRVAGIDLAGVVVKDVVASFPDKEFQHPRGMNSEGGNLGNGLLQHFNVAFDYAHDKLYLAPNRSFDKPFEWDMTGLWLDPDDNAALRVGNIIPKSPAEAAGLKVGDIVTEVNGKPVSAKDLPVLFKDFRQEGTVMAMTLTRDGKPVEATLRLKRLV